MRARFVVLFFTEQQETLCILIIEIQVDNHLRAKMEKKTRLCVCACQGNISTIYLSSWAPNKKKSLGVCMCMCLSHVISLA